MLKVIEEECFKQKRGNIMANLTTEQIEAIKNDFDKCFTKEQEKNC